MNTALWGGKNKQHQTHTNTLETKTIRVKSWRNSLHLNRRAPAIAAIVAGFFMLTALPSLAVVFGSEKELDTSDAAKSMSLPTSSGASFANQANSKDTDNNPASDPPNNETSTGSSSSVSINMSVSSSSSTNGEETNNAPKPTVSINGQAVDLPSSGRIREEIEDENSRTRIRGNIDSDGDSSISISTDFNDSGGD